MKCTMRFPGASPVETKQQPVYEGDTTLHVVESACLVRAIIRQPRGAPGGEVYHTLIRRPPLGDGRWIGERVGRYDLRHTLRDRSGQKTRAAADGDNQQVRRVVSPSFATRPPWSARCLYHQHVPTSVPPIASS